MKQSNRTRVYKALRKDILELRLEPGTMLAEQHLSERYGTSRTPIREAFQILAAEGLIRQVPGHGSFVAEISMDDIVELFQVREALETYAARLAAQSTAAPSLAALRTSFYEASERLRNGEHDWYYEVTNRMDRQIATLANNERLKDMLSDIWAQVFRIRRLATANQQRLLESVDEHIQIIDAVAAGKADEAATAVSNHIQNSLRNVLISVTPHMSS